MTLAVVILANSGLGRVEQVARWLSRSGVYTCIHVDADVRDKRFRRITKSLAHLPNIHFCKRISCEWGRFSLVEAEIIALEETLKKWPDASHIQLISDDSLPIKPIAYIEKFLSEHPETDFVESVAVEENNWIEGGLGQERFTLYFPFSWKTQRWLFDRWVDIQRRLKIRRRIPRALDPHIGSQWWCLTRQTAEAILTDPNAAKYKKYFAQCWIPDESYFQTLVRLHSKKLQSRSLLYSKFDHQGKPTVFYNDHLKMLRESTELFVRKVWHGSDHLYQGFLESSENTELPASNTNLTQHIDHVAARRKVGRTGLRMQSSHPNRWHEPFARSASKYIVLSGCEGFFPNISDWVEQNTKLIPHGRLFHKNKAHFRNNGDTGPGGLSAHFAVRDTSPECFLLNLLWNSKPDRLLFHYEVEDNPDISRTILNDPNATVCLVKNGWLPGLLNEGIENPDLLKRKANLMISKESQMLAIAQEATPGCELKTIEIRDLIGQADLLLRQILKAAGKPDPSAVFVLPDIADVKPILDFAQKLMNMGIPVELDRILPDSKQKHNGTVRLIQK